MSDEPKATIHPPGEDRVEVNNGSELAKVLGVPTDEGVLVAVLPDLLEDVVTREISALDKKDDRYHEVIANLGSWGKRVMDVVSVNGCPVKWWQVKEMAEGDLIPVRWHGPIGEIPSSYFEKNYVLAIRFYQHGPWFFPKEQPRVKSDIDEQKEISDAVDAR